jgi:MFS family permease
MPERSSATQPSAARNIYAFGMTSFLNDTATEMAYWVLPAFLISLGAGPAELGLIEGVAESVASFAKLFSGYLTDRIDRRKPLVVAGYFVANAVKPLLALATAWWHILLIRFSDRLAKGVRGAPRDVMVAESVPKERLGSAYGLIQSMDSAGAIAGPCALWNARCVLGRRSSGRTLRDGSAVRDTRDQTASLLATDAKNGAPWRFLGGSRAWNRTEDSGKLRCSRDCAAWRVLYGLDCGDSVFAGKFQRHVSGDAGAERGHPGKTGAAIGAGLQSHYTLGSWPAGWVSDRFSRRWIAAAGYLIFAAVYYVFGRAPSTLAIWITMAIYGLYYALTQPVLKALVVETVGQEVRGRALGVYFFVTSVATLAASLITGELWKHYGASIPFYFSAGLAAVSALLLAIKTGGVASPLVSG